MVFFWCPNDDLGSILPDPVCCRRDFRRGTGERKGEKSVWDQGELSRGVRKKGPPRTRARVEVQKPLRLADHAHWVAAHGRDPTAIVDVGSREARPKPTSTSFSHALNGTIFWRCSPSPSMPMRTSSPGFSHFGSFMPSATPAGVPVVTTSPGSSTKNWLM